MEYKTYSLKLIYNIARRNVKSVNINVTDRCNSKCKTCYIWKKQPKHDIPIETIEKLLNDKMINKKTLFGLTGGEFLLHPKYRDILSMFSDYNYLLFSNGILADRLIETVNDFGVKNLFISADGVDDRYRDVRGVDTFKSIRKVVKALHGKTKITIDFTISPFNSKQDLIDIVSFCEDNDVKIIVGVYNEPEFFDTNTPPKTAFEFNDIKSGAFYFSSSANNLFIKLYNKWINGNLNLSCYSIRSLFSVLPNGDISLCQGKNEILGNLNKNSLSEIWNSEKTIEAHKRNRNCNSCFLSCQRPIDVVIDKTPLKWIIK